VGDGVLLSGAGCWADVVQLSEIIASDNKVFKWQNQQNLGVEGVANLLSLELYSRRNFPYYSFCILAGIDSAGNLYSCCCIEMVID
jgi:20S proteasome subunit beta 6